jgi:hypothetical protein
MMIGTEHFCLTLTGSLANCHQMRLWSGEANLNVAVYKVLQAEQRH